MSISGGLALAAVLSVGFCGVCLQSGIWDQRFSQWLSIPVYIVVMLLVIYGLSAR